MSYSKNSNHVEEGLDNLVSQFKKPRILILNGIYIQQLQEVEDTASDLLTETTLDNSFGIHLDNIGGLLGEDRFGRGDDEYRIAIETRIILNDSDGTIEDVISLSIGVAVEPITITITELFPAGFIAAINEVIDPAITDVGRIASFIKSGRPGGVQGFLTYGIDTPTFAYDGAIGTGYDVGNGKYGGALPA